MDSHHVSFKQAYALASLPCLLFIKKNSLSGIHCTSCCLFLCMVISLVLRFNRFSYTSHQAENLGWDHLQPPIFPVQGCWIIFHNSDYFNRWVCPLLVDIHASLNAWERLLSVQHPFGVLGNGGTPSHCLQAYGLPLSHTITSINSPWLRTEASFFTSYFSPHFSSLRLLSPMLLSYGQCSGFDRTLSSLNCLTQCSHNLWDT